MDFGSKKKTSPTATAVVAHDDKSKDGDSSVSASAGTSAAPAVHDALTGEAPLLNETIKVEPMGDILAANEVSSERKKVATEAGGLIDVEAGQSC